MFDALLKIGGSLYRQRTLRAAAARWAALATEYRLLLLPGGGPFADQVRAADARLGLRESAAHWMAILAMDQYAYLLADIIPGAVLVRTLEDAEAAGAGGRAAVLAPSTLLRKEDPLPHDWQVTSDSIAAWLAGYTGIELLVLLKDVSGVYDTDTASVLSTVSRSTLTSYNVVDAYFPQMLPANLACWIIDGRRSERVVQLLRDGTTTGTQVLPVYGSAHQAGT